MCLLEYLSVSSQCSDFIVLVGMKRYVLLCVHGKRSFTMNTYVGEGLCSKKNM